MVSRGAPGRRSARQDGLVEVADTVEPPLRLPFGKDAIARIVEKNAFVERETSRWLALAVSTGYEEAAREEKGSGGKYTTDGVTT